MKSIKLTPYQSIFYYEWLNNPSRSDYNVVIDNTVTGKLDQQRYNDSFEQLLNEHFITRHVVQDTEHGLCWQLIEPVVNLTVFHDQPLTDEQIYALVTEPFDLHQGPLVRIHLIKLNEERYRMLFIFHHIVVDGISTEEIWDKWRKLYNGEVYQIPSLAEQTIMHQNLYQYFECLLSNNRDDMQHFWQQHLQNLHGVDLSFLQTNQRDNKSQPLSTLTEYVFSFDENTTKQVNRLRRQYKITPYLFGQLVMAILLNKMSSSNDIALAYPIAILEGKALLYGAHINTMIIDYRFNEQTTLASLIEQTLAFYKDLKTSHAKYLPINEIIRCSGDSSILNVAFAQTFYRDHEAGLIDVENETVNHDFQVDLASKLLFEQQEHNHQIHYRIRFDRHVLDRNLVNNFMGYYQTLFVDILNKLTSGNGHVAIDDITLIDPEYGLTLPIPSCVAPNVSPDVVAQFEYIAHQFPERLAIVYDDQTLTYQQLNEQANQLAHYLISQFKLKPDDLIALCLEKSTLMPICILAVLKSGAAYVPIDPNVPKQRLAYILQDTQAKVLLTQHCFIEALNEINDSQTLFIPIDRPDFNAKLSDYNNENLNQPLNPNQLAYIIYTSGTTGVPKGVMLEHQGLANLATMQAREFGLALSNKMVKNCLWYASYVFDAHVSELFTAIANGHVLHILAEQKRLDFHQLADYISAANIDIATIPPALLHKDLLLPLQTLVVAGESCNLEIMEQYHQQGTCVINAYGPTEATVCATLHHYQMGDNNLNIGLPLTNTQVHILNQRLEPVPPGVIGDLYLSGIGLARGYLNNTEQTDQVFITHQCNTAAQTTIRLYKTGDLARQMLDGTLEYAGRKDFQVKVRGFRIELAEIENCLTQMPQINQAIVLAQTLKSGLKCLTAYYLATSKIDESSMVTYLSEYLPDYMQPSYFVHLTQFPLTVNGKLDRTALPLPQLSTQTHYHGPTNEIEAALCQIYAQVLACDVVGIDDDFLKLGGDSISGILLVSKIRHQLQANVSIQDIFSHKTVRLLAKCVAASQVDQNPDIVAEKGQLTGTFKLLPIQQWFFERVERRQFLDINHWNQAFILHVPKLDLARLQQSLTLLFNYHDALRMIFSVDTDGNYNQHYRQEIGALPFDYIHLANSQYTEQQLFNQWQLGFDINHGPLCHIGYIESNDYSHAKLHFAFHHLIIDAISWHIIKQDLHKIYQYLTVNTDRVVNAVDILGEKSSSYRQWVAQLHDYSHVRDTQDEQTYWLNITQNIAAYCQHLKPLFTHKQLNYLTLTLDKSDTANLQTKVHRVLATQINDILLASFVSAFKAFSDIDEQYITLEGHGRESTSTRLDISRTVGWFTNMYPIHVSANADMLTNVAHVKDSLAAIPYRGIGFAPLFGYRQEMLAPISFNYLGQFDGASEQDWTFQFADVGESSSQHNLLTNLLSVDCGIIGGELKIKLSAYLDDVMLAQFAQHYLNHLQLTIDQLLSVDRQYLTLADIDHTISACQLTKIQHDTEVEDIYLANSLQEGFIYHAISQGQVDDAYRTQMCWDYDNAIDVPVLKTAWQLLQGHYASLRLRFNWDEELVQIIDKTAELNWSYHDITAQSAPQQQSFLADLRLQDRNLPYDLTIAGLFRVYLIKHSNLRYSCIFSTHHAIIDGWSNPIIIKAVHDIYLALISGQKVTLTPNKYYQNIQRYLQKNRAEHLSYWQQYISQQHTQEDLSLLLADQARGTILSHYKHITTPVKKTLVLDNHLYYDLKSITTEYALTMNAILQYCWHKVLSVYTGSENTLVGMVVAGRNLPVDGIEETVGLLINTLPLIVEHQHANSLLNAIQALQRDIQEANSRSNVNLASLQQSGERLFSSLFVFENYPMPENCLANALKINFLGAEEKQDYPLVVSVLEQEQQLNITLCYAGELFDSALIDSLLATFKQIVKQIAHDPLEQHNHIDYLDEQQQQKVIYDWNETHCDYCADQTVVSLFEQQVTQSSAHLAVMFNDISLTYAQLNEQANQLAHYLQITHQIQPNDFIGLYFDRSEKIVVSIFAVLKLGAVYVPMDPSAPDERNQFIMCDAKAKVILTEQAYYTTLCQFNSAVVVIDDPKVINDISAQRTSNPIHRIDSGDIAYCIYTSGTTGKPKGNLISHQNINRLVINPNYTEINSNDRLLAISGYQFDASIFDIFGALLNGATLVLLEKQKLLDLSAFNQLLADRQITQFFTPTAFFNSLVDAELIHLAQIDTIFVGGEALSVNHVNHFRKRYPNVKLLNVYGPTETTTYATAFLTNHQVAEFNATVPIGRPISNTCVYILNEQLKPVPVGAVGELYIGGAGVGQGYLNKPELTENVFISNPFQRNTNNPTNDNARMYKTGDLVRYLANGDIEYLGRNDSQVKIRGFRIELGEIESQLMTHPAIKQALIVAKESVQGGKQLVAYYVALHAIKREELFDYLSQRLPDYMLPVAFIYLEALPLTINGKIDRAALPTVNIDDSDNYVAPVSITEHQLTEVYSELLGININDISVTADFFRMGGNSILAIKLANRLSTRCSKSIHVADIFNYKTIRLLSQYIDTLSQASLKITVCNPASIQEQKLSFAQERLWFIDSYEGGSDAYNIPLTLVLKRQTSLTVLIKALNKVIERHEILRTVIKTNNQGEGYQQVLPAELVKISLTCQKCHNANELNDYLSLHAHNIFDLSEQIPLSVQAYQLEQTCYLSLVIHHIAFDGWSIELLSNELNHYYHFYDQPGKVLDLPDIPIQYKDFALWQRQYLQADQLQSQMDYWQSILHDYQPLNLALDYVRPLKFDYHGVDIHFNLTLETSQKLRQLAAQLNVSLYTVLLSGYYLLLNAFSNQSDIILGTPIAGRHYPGIENTLGFFVNTLVLRSQINAKDGVSDFIKATAQHLAQAQAHQDLPFEKLIDVLQIDKDASRHPLFQVMFGVQSFGAIDEYDSQSLFTPYQSPEMQYQVAKFDLSTMMDDSQDCIRGVFNYATALFKADTITKYISVYRHILDQLSELVSTQQQICHVNYLTTEQYQTIINDWNDTDCEFYADKTIVNLFEEQVTQFAYSPAVMFNDVTLTYAQLNQQANQLAHYLQTHYQIQPNDFIGLYLNRSEQIVIAMLAVLKAGGAYVPIDPDTPNERNAYIIDDAKVKAVITQTCYESKIKQFSPDVALIVIDQDNLHELISLQCHKNIISKTQPTDLAYAIYTSGTTGQPKGTLICHYNVNRLVINPRYTEITPSDRFLDISGYQFDASIYDIFGPLLNGASVVIAEKQRFLDLEQFNHLLVNYKISNCFITAAFFNILVDAGVKNLGLLKYILVGGEALSAYHVNQFRQQYPNVKLVNGYGPTETTTFAVTYQINTATQPFSVNVPIGRPINNTSLYILDPHLRPVPLGGIGELYIGGEGVGLGYLNNPELTAKVFIANPFQSEKQRTQGRNARLYKTGDLVRYLDNGIVEYLGRNDFQVKIRGFRIELAEIETQLAKHPQVKQALVIARNNSHGDKQLIAYYLALQPIENHQLQDYLAQFLPEYMIPAAFIQLDTLPLTLNGKVNLAALPTATLVADRQHVAAMSITEHRIAKLFSELLVLDTDNISINDDFFRLGGNSILAIKLANRITNSCRKSVHVADIFNYKTISRLSQYIDKIASQQRAILPQQVDCVEQQLLSFAQERLWFIDRYERGSNAYNIPLVLQLNQQLSLITLTQALNKILERHEILRTIIKTNSAGEGYQQVLPMERVKLNIEHKKCQHIDELNQAITTHIHQVFDLATDTPLSVQSYQLSAQTYLSLVIHHIAFDGWSIDLLIKELNYYYLLFNASKSEPDLPAVAIQYKDFALWQRQYLQGEHLQTQLDYWRNKLQDYQLLNLPLDHPRPKLMDYRGNDIHFSLTLETSQQLRQLAANLNVSLYTVLLSGYYLLLQAYSNQSDIILGTPIAGRQYADIENTMGFFVNTLVLRREIDEYMPLADFIRTTGQQLIEAQQYQDLPFEKLVDALSTTQDPSRHPIFQVMFGVQSFGSSINDCQSESLFTTYQTDCAQYQVAKFDLTTILDDSQDVIKGFFNYATALFNPETIARYIEVYSDILKQMGEAYLQQQPISQLRYLNDSSYDKVIHRWNQTQLDYPCDKTIAQMFEVQAARTPDNIAVVYENCRLTYQQLNERANQLATYLKQQFQIQPDDLVAICLDKTEQLIVSMLAVLKAGGAYVPLSPKLPSERQNWIVYDTCCKVVMTSSQHIDALSKSLKTTTTLLNLDDIDVRNNLNTIDINNLDCSATANDLAYIIYTSGTTGRPKGVMIEHHCVINATYIQRSVMGLAACAVDTTTQNILWYSDYTFDAHVLDVFTTLLTGNCLHIFAQDKCLDLQALIEYATEQHINYAFIPPALLDKTTIIPIDKILLGGESVSQQIVDHYLANKRQLINAYGPTEATIWVTYHHYRSGDINSNIGRPIYNASVYVLDRQLRPVPVGAFGELYIGGVGVARGYLNNSELTRRVFIDNPFQSEIQRLNGHNCRLYKTGDIVRYLEDGSLEYIGRNDFQVKIRGFRIELAEIEAQLIQYQVVKQALVLACDNAQGDKQLIAYYVADESIQTDDLIVHLKQSLPEYMIPASFIHLEELPLTLAGKVNRSQLPAVSFSPTTTCVKAVTQTEHIVTEVYSQLLALPTDSISITDDFFRMGGNSILAIKLATRLADKTAKAVHIADIFHYKTIQAISEYIDSAVSSQLVIKAPQVKQAQDQLLSFAQERLWFIDNYEGGSCAYNIPLTLQFTQDISFTVLAKALNKIVQRHEILRTIIKTNIDGVGYQYILSSDSVHIALDPILCQTTAELNAQMTAHINQIFDLTKQIPLSAQSYQLGEICYLSLVIHHIAFDGWSVDLLMKELNHYYHFFSSTDNQVELVPVNVQYKEFALWQRQYLQGVRLQSQLDYWYNRLVDYQPLNLPVDYPRPSQIDYRGADIGFHLTLETSQKLRQLAADLNVSLYTVLLSGYYLFLRAYSNQSDIILGTPIAGRHYSGIEDTMGFFVNTLTLRREIDPDQSVIDFIQATGILQHEAQQHQDLPFEKLVEALKIEKDTSRHPLFQVMFGLQSFGVIDQNEAKSIFMPYQASSGYNIAKFDLSTMLDDSQTIISGNFNYATSLFKAETITNYINVYCYILDQLSELANRNQTIKQLRYLDEVNYNKVIMQWNQTKQDYPHNKTIHQMFEEQVIRTPDNIAVIYEGEGLSYRQLNEQANQLAAYLRDNFAIQGDDLVALYLDRSLFMPIAILAILKSGGAYVPIDPLAPTDRSRYILTDTKAKVILTVTACYDKCLSLVAADQCVVDLQSTAIIAQVARYTANHLSPIATANNLAYVIYTSGTTGNPKGVMLEHRGVINRILWMHKAYPINPQDRILQKTNYTFDVSVWELFWANWYGACIVFSHSEHYKDNVYLATLIESEQVTVLHFVPSMLVAFVETIAAQPSLQAKLQKLKYLFCSGEALNLYEVQHCHRLLPNCQIHNLYGPTEATVDVLYYDCNEPGIKQVLIGKPIDNTSAYVLDDCLQAVPLGGIGELYVGGDGVARGYLHNPTLSNERFIANPFQTAQELQQQYNSRIYKTGDVVRYMQDGNIEYLGRNDFQVKIRGYRIELNEIEACLMNYFAINYAVVIAYERSVKDKYLVAYYVANCELDTQEIMSHLRQKLPEYMIPTAFVHLDALPVTSNGKLDRKQLPKPELTHSVVHVSPENEHEMILSEIFADTLNIAVGEISMTHNFFTLGGNSILAMKLNSRINQVFQVKLSLVDILNAHTIKALAIKLSTTDKLVFNPVIAMSAITDKPQLFMIHPGMGGCSVYLSLANRLAHHYCCYGVDSYNFYHENKIDHISQLARYYLSYIDKICDFNQPITLLGWSLGGQIALEIATMLEARNFTNIKICALDTWLLNQDDLNEDRPNIDLDQLMLELNIPKYLRANVVSVADVDMKLSLQPLSAKLKYTKVLLFKAMQEKGFGALHHKYTFNNIDAYLYSAEQLRVVPLSTDHYKILEKEQEIIDQLLNVLK
ncbi:non-ribosomal peptide synthase protein (TIGR01720 family)/amino acid adenylation domain-containing protein [Orbus hercynius]|uniref:Non-ribosomal peptide synthase protein (TIGR01720 family)/amino acid adenylation domain-containing protein n=1 Tax=Orbus hercynius TaxID=593135 RepID=A0A495RJ82_9GAMM|nr:non-ribosomal peptide synthetase [Orbus hercynius]RKS87567.1 non-ribosomal peptide synthase protein (TIGR01720 family)/amino acid adenylation domain-containing protein [Orbus hercynius]